ncbi:MAG: hypothetical protein LLG44_02835 [Chloroflexi bacterium]|nr:hypothetical protein [Chloroflexota bacterium]
MVKMMDEGMQPALVLGESLSTRTLDETYAAILCFHQLKTPAPSRRADLVGQHQRIMQASNNVYILTHL